MCDRVDGFRSGVERVAAQIAGVRRGREEVVEHLAVVVRDIELVDALRAEETQLLALGARHLLERRLARCVKQIQLVIGRRLRRGGAFAVARPLLVEVVSAERLDAARRQTRLFLGLAPRGLFGCLRVLRRAADDAPVAGEHDLRVVVA